MADVKRFSGRTYGRAPKQESPTTKAFDDVFAKPKQAKWGNVSYVKNRLDGDGVDKKAAVEEEEDDPFSFEFDGNRSPKKKAAPKQPARTVVMQPAVRIASIPSKRSFKTDLDDEGMSDDLTVKKANIQPYSKNAGSKIKKELPESQPRMDKFVKMEQKELHSTDSSQGTPKSSSEPMDTNDSDDDLYIENDDGSSTASPHVPDEPFVLKEEPIFDRRTRQRESRQNITNSAGEEITVRFRSQYLNPEVYSKFTENVRPKDPVGNLSNSKVVHKNVLKHDSGTTLIVVCSPKVGDSEIKQSTTQSRYFKDNAKGIAKSNKRLTKAQKEKSPEKDPFELDDDENEASRDSTGASVAESETSESHLVQEEPPTPSQEYTTRSGRVTRTVRFADPPVPIEPVDVDNIVNKLKTAPPRKYHRIFRSRNKGFMDPNAPHPEQENEGEKEPEVKQEKLSDPPTSEDDDKNGPTDGQESGEVNGESPPELTPAADEGNNMDTQEDSHTGMPTVFGFDV